MIVQWWLVTKRRLVEIWWKCICLKRGSIRSFHHWDWGRSLLSNMSIILRKVLFGNGTWLRRPAEIWSKFLYLRALKINWWLAPLHRHALITSRQAAVWSPHPSDWLIVRYRRHHLRRIPSWIILGGSSGSFQMIGGWLSNGIQSEELLITPERLFLHLIGSYQVILISNLI